jgi:hypothetical protein
MKTFQNILKIFFGVIIATAILNTAVGQSIKTPMNQTVYTLYNGDTAPLIAEWEAAGANWISDHSSGAQRVGAATSNYNCHSWAWHVSDGGSSSNSWINYLHNGGANLSKYWTNDAYSSGSPYNDDNCKLFYGTTADHSASMTTSSGVVISKWGAWPRYQHSTSDCPYQSSPVYTVYSSPISGDNDICTSKTYSAINISGASYTWSGNKLSTSGSAYSTTATKTSDGAGWIHAEIYSPYSGTTFGSAKKPIWLGVPSTTSVTMPSQNPPYEGCTYTSHTFRAQPANSVSTQSYYSWEIDPNDGSISTSGNGEYSYITFYNEYSVAGYDVKARGTNSCGTGPFGETNIWIYDCYYFAISPNPASDIVTITRVLASEETDGKTIMMSADDENTTCDIQIVDYYGSLRLQTTKSGDSFTLPVSNLKDGTYFVKITNGNKTSNLKLVVKH